MPDAPREPGGKRVLLVDDEPDIRRLLAAYVQRKAGIPTAVTTAASAEEALGLLEETRFDVVVSDLRMPGLSGLQLLRQVASRWPSTRRLLMTGFNDVGPGDDSVRAAGVDYVLTKPFDPGELLRALDAGSSRAP